MYVPTDAVERMTLYHELRMKCMYFLEQLRPFYITMQNYYERGASQGESPPFNNIYPHIDLVRSMLYAQDTTRFGAVPAATESAEVFEKTPIVARRVQQEWEDSNTDIVFGEAVRMALIYQTSFVKIISVGKALHSYTVDPLMFGVLREDAQFLDRQQAFVHNYSISLAALETMLRDHPSSEKIMASVTSTHTEEAKRTSGLDRILVSSTATSPTLTGQAILPWVDMPVPQPSVAEPLVQMYELYVWDDRLEDYRVITMAEPSVVVYERTCKDVFIKGEHPFIQVCPNPKDGSFRGDSEVNKLRNLQDMLSERLWNIRKMLNRQADPPKVGYGFTGPADEIAMALTDPAAFTEAEQGFKVEELSPTIPADLFSEVDRIMSMFEITSGITPALQGRGQAGVRSAGQFSEMARYGSARIRSRALTIEDSIEKCATLMFKLLRKYNDDMLIDGTGKPFLLAQIGDDIAIKVDAHSSSPAFSEDLKQTAFALRKVNAIDDEALIDMVAPPNADALKAAIRARMKAAAEEHAKELASGVNPAHDKSSKRNGKPLH